MAHLLTAVAQAATDTVDTVKAALPALPKELEGIPPQVWEKLPSHYVFGPLERAMKSPWEELVGNLVPIVFFLVIGFVIWLSVTRKSKRDEQRHQEAMAMIEKGIYEPPPVQEPVYRKERYLLAGIILSGLGLAFLLYFAVFLEVNEALIAAFLFLFPGLGLVGFYRLLEKKEQREEEKKKALEEHPPS